MSMGGVCGVVAGLVEGWPSHNLSQTMQPVPKPALYFYHLSGVVSDLEHILFEITILN